MSRLDVPCGCIPANALRSLASVMDRMTAWHTSRGGQLADEPCLTRVEVVGDRVTAHVTVGRIVSYSLELHNGSWEGFR